MRPLGNKRDFFGCKYGCCKWDAARYKDKCLKKKSRRKDKVRIVYIKE